jgi:cytochrome P450
MTGSFADFWTSSIIAQEGPEHKTLRQLAVPVLSQDFIHSLQPAFDNIAEDLAARLTRLPSVEFMADFATPFAGRVICALLNEDQDEWLDLATDASTLGLAMGVQAKSHETRVNAACDRLMQRAARLLDRAREGDDQAYVGRLVAQAQKIGSINDTALLNLMVISIFGGVDTTRAQLGFLVRLFIDHPGQWQALRDDPGLAENAVEEAIRQNPTTTWSTREAVEDFTFDGVDISKGQTLHMLVHATATDPMVLPDAAFDITTRRKAHHGFGGGAHNCLGMAVARADIAAALRALARHVDRFEWSGTPEFLPDSGNTSPRHLPVRVIAA